MIHLLKIEIIDVPLRKYISSTLKRLVWNNEAYIGEEIVIQV
jgi:hypothetical protein